MRQGEGKTQGRKEKGVKNIQWEPERKEMGIVRCEMTVNGENRNERIETRGKE